MNPLFDIIEEDSRLETRNETVYFADGMVDIILHIPESADGSTIVVAVAFLSIFSTTDRLPHQEHCKSVPENGAFKLW